MNQSKAQKLIPKLKFNLHERRNLKNPEGPQGRHNKIRKTVTALFKYERIEMNYHRADESRGYAERLISDAIKYGDCHKPTMELADYWLLEKQLVHKLFKVLVPRYQNLGLSYTKLWKAPNIYPGRGRPKCVLELRNNIFPTLGEDKSFNKNLIHNVLLEAARKSFESQKAKQAAETAAGGATVKETSADSTGSDVTEEVINASTSEHSDSHGTNSEEIKRTDSENKTEEVTSDNIENDFNKLEIDKEKVKESPDKKEEK